MKAPVGLLSNRTVCASKMEGPCPDKFGFVQLCWDWIVRYCLEHKIYNINQVNTLLFEYDQEQLGA